MYRSERDIRGSALPPALTETKGVKFSQGKRDRADFYHDLEDTTHTGHNKMVFDEDSPVHTWIEDKPPQKDGGAASTAPAAAAAAVEAAKTPSAGR
jgi:hypothetical protein